MNKKLYNLTIDDARTLLEHYNYDVATLGILLWDKNKASSIERGVYKAKKLINFVNKGQQI